MERDAYCYYFYKWKDSCENPNCINKEKMPALILRVFLLRVFLLRAPFSFSFVIFIKNFKGVTPTTLASSFTARDQ